MTLDIFIPAYNEAPIIAETVRAVISELNKIQNISWHIIVVDNGSTDGTSDVVTSLGIQNVSVLSIETKGKGAALIAAAKDSTAEVFGFIDADLSAHPRAIAELLSLLVSADIVIGSRLHKDSNVKRSWWRSFSSKLFNGVRRVMLGLDISDTQCGLKLANAKGRAELAKCLEQGWFFDIEWLARAHQAGLRIKEMPISWDEYRYAGRKSKLHFLKYGLQSMVAFARIRRELKSNS